MSECPRISVVIPLFNKAGTVRRAIASILAQNIADIEIIVVDDGCTDGSADAVTAVADERIMILTQPNAGPGSARNNGAARARADLIAFLDGDDEWLPGFLQTGLAALDQHQNAVAYVSGYSAGAFSDRVDNKAARVTAIPALLPPPEATDGVHALLDRLNGLHSSSIIVRRTAFREAGGFYDLDRCLWGEDAYLWGQVLFKGPIYWDPTPRILFHVEDSALGFAVTYRTCERPIAMLTNEILATVAPEHRAAFAELARHVASQDAIDLSRSGAIGRCVSLRRRHNILNLKHLLGDGRRYLGHLPRRMKRRLIKAT